MAMVLTGAPATARRAGSRSAARPGASRAVMLGLVLAAVGVGVSVTGSDASAQAVSGAGGDLTRLLRFMALIKAVPAVAAVAAVYWRLGAAVTMPRFAAYAGAVVATSAGPGLIWTMVHVGLGAALLHGGLATTVLLLWFDPAVAARLDLMLKRRRVASRA